MTITTKSIQSVTVVKGKYAKEVLKEALSKPTEEAKIKNEEASALLKRLRGERCV